MVALTFPPNIHWLNGLCSSHRRLNPGVRYLRIVSRRRRANWEFAMPSIRRQRSSSALSCNISRENSGMTTRKGLSFPLYLWRGVTAWNLICRPDFWLFICLVCMLSNIFSHKKNHCKNSLNFVMLSKITLKKNLTF